MNAKQLIVATAMIICAYSSDLMAQNSMGIGTTTPNANAVLELVSPGNNQGFLVPRLTTAERTSMSLGAGDNGLLVFDTDDQLFYFWVDPSWAAVSNGANGDMLASVYDPDQDGSVTSSDSVSVGFFDGVTIQYNAGTGQMEVRDAGISANKLSTSSVQTVKIADGAIVASKVATGAITTTEILDGTIGSADLANSSVTGNKIANGVITSTKLGSASVQTAAIEDGAVTSAKIGISATNGQVLKYNGTSWVASNEDNAVSVDGTTITGNGTDTPLAVGVIGTANFSDGSVTSVKMADAAVIASKIATGAVTSTGILDGTIGSADLANSAVTGNKIANGVITSTKLGSASVQTAAIEDGAVTSAKIGIAGTNGQVLKYNGTSWVASNEDNAVSVDGTTITGNGTDTPLAAGVIGTANFSDGSVTTAKMAASAVVASKIATGAVTSTGILDGTIGTTDLADASVTSTKLGTSAVQTANIADGSVTSSKLGFSAATGDVLTYNGASWSPTANVSSQWVTTGSDIYYNTGAIAVGTTSPAAPVHIQSSGTTTGGLLLRDDAGGDAAITFNETTGAYTYSMGIDYSDAGKFKISRSTSPGGSAFFAVDANNQFGFGTLTPQDILHAHESASSLSSLRLTHSTSGLSGSDGVAVQSNGSNAYLRNYETGSTFIGTNGAYTSIGATGNMSVSGSVSASSFIGDGSALTGLTNSYSNGFYVSDALTGNISPTLFVSRADGNSAVAINFNNTAGQFSLGLTSAEGFALSAPGANVGLSGDYLRVTNTGDVGIGVANPSAKLDVNGSVEATDFVYPAASPKQFFFTVPPSSFQLSKTGSLNDQEILMSANGSQVWVGYTSSEGAANMHAPIYLPNGAIITEVVVYGNNPGSFSDASIYLTASNFSTTSTETLLTKIPIGTSGVTGFTAADLSIPINLNSFAYSIHVLTYAAASSPTITGIRITYTKTTLD